MKVNLDCTLRDVEAAGDLLVGKASGHQARDLCLPSRQLRTFVQLRLSPHRLLGDGGFEQGGRDGTASARYRPQRGDEILRGALLQLDAISAGGDCLERF